MSIFNELEKIKQTGLPQFLIVAGEVEDILTEAKNQIFEFVGFDSNDMGQSYFDLDTQNADFALEELESLPFFADKKLVIFENLSNLTTAKKIIFDEKQMQRFESFLDNPLETTQLIIVLHGKLDSRLKVTKKLKKIATILTAEELKSQELNAYFQSKTALKNNILRAVFEKSNFTFSTIKQNIALLETYAMGKEISLADVEKVVPKSLQDNIFDLTDLIFKGKLNEARTLIADLLLQGEEVIKILTILTNSYRLYYQVKLMKDKGWSEIQQTSQLKIHPYRVKLANQVVGRLSSQNLAQSLKLLIETDYQIKSGYGDAKYLLDLSVIKLAAEE